MTATKRQMNGLSRNCSPDDDGVLSRIPPHDLDAEKAVLGSLLLDPSRIDEVAGILRSSDFYASQAGETYAAILEMHETKQPIDAALLLGELRGRAGQYATPWAAWMAECAQAVPYAMHAAFYAATVARASKYRRIISAASDALVGAYEADGEPEELASQLEAAVAEAVAGASPKGEPVHIRQAVGEAMARIDQIARRERTAGLLTGFESFDRHIGGMFAGELHVLAARPGVGKTAMACQIAHHTSERARLVYHVTLEMSAAELATRVLCAQSGVDSRRVRGGTLDGHDRAALASVGEPLAQGHWLLDDRHEVSAPEIGRTARRLRPKGLALVIVDYLQIVAPEDRSLKRYEQVGQIARRLKLLARELDVPVLCLCQVAREADGERPMLKHLRESGDVEQHADAVSFLYEASAKDRKEGKAQQNEVRWEVAKNRNGPVGLVRLLWEATRTMFSTLDASNAGWSQEAAPHEEFSEFSRDESGAF